MDYSASYSQDPRRSRARTSHSGRLPTYGYIHVGGSDSGPNNERIHVHAVPPPTYARPTSRLSEEAETRRRRYYGSNGRAENYAAFPAGDDVEEDVPPLVAQTRASHQRTGRREDLTLKSQGHIDNEDPEIRDYMIVCLYGNSKKAFKWTRVRLVKKDGRERRDRNFFGDMRAQYKTELRGALRRVISFKTVSTARLLQYGSGRFFTADQNDKLFSPAFMKVFEYPLDYLEANDSEWTMWLRAQKVRQPGLDLAVELIEDYDAMRVMGMAGFILLTLLVLSVVWLLEGGDAAYVTTVMSFVLGFLTALVGLTALWDWLDQGHMEIAKENAVLGEKDRHDLDDLMKGGAPFQRQR